MEFDASALTPPEAEVLVRQLKPFAVEHIGSSAWKDQRESIEHLNMCTHTNAKLKKDDFVKSYLVEHEKLVVLVHELLAMEVWRHHVLPKITEDIVGNPTGVYWYCYYESVLLNLIECLMFYEEVAVGFSDDILELIEYCWRQVSSYIAEGAKIGKAEELPDPKAASIEDHNGNFARQMFAQQAARCMSSISCLWFVCDRLHVLPMAVTNAVLVKHDLLIGFTEVLLSQPWTRRSRQKTQKYIGGQFQNVEQDDTLRVCIPEAHSWFIVHKLLCDRDCRMKYQYTSSRKEIIMRIKRFLNETLIDQIPALVDVQRALEELGFLEPPSGTEEKFRSTLVIEQVPRLRTALERGGKWDRVANEMSSMLRDPQCRIADAQRVSKLFDAMFHMTEEKQE
jgi:hypothetical protein